jgi:polyhydroxyalkanoate synthesis regulator phasin
MYIILEKYKGGVWKNMKKISIIIFVIMSLLITFGTTQSWAGEIDILVNKLVEKGLLSHSEAQQLLNEMQKEAVILEEQRKQEVVKEIKDKELAVPKALKGLEVGMLAYVDYSNGIMPEPGDRDSSFNHFRITRGYLTVKKEILPWMHTRITLDTHQDSEGDYKERLKYLYAEFRPPDLGPLTGMKSEVGLGHIPWLDFEEHVNPYRCQGTMAIERAGTFNSADTGISLRGDFAGKLENAKEKTGNHHYNGYYGSWHLGVYNGSGYHASEKNNNKVVEGRLTLRPLPELIPGLQLSYFGIYGEGNDKASNGDYPDYEVNMGMLSYEHPWGILTAQYFQTEGNAKGKWVDADGDALDTEGYSFFGNLRLPVFERKFSLFARYDHFDQDDDNKIGNDADYDMYVGGIAWDIYKGNMLLLSYETTNYGDDAGTKGNAPVLDNQLGDDRKVQAVWQVKF